MQTTSASGAVEFDAEAPLELFEDGDLERGATTTTPAAVREARAPLRGALVGEIYEVEADGERQTLRILFAPEGEHGQALLLARGFSKKTQKTPPAGIRLAEQRLAERRARGRRNPILSDILPVI